MSKEKVLELLEAFAGTCEGLGRLEKDTGALAEYFGKEYVDANAAFEKSCRDLLEELKGDDVVRDLRCPRCGETDKILYLEEITCARHILGFCVDTNTLRIEEHYETAGWDDEGQNMRLYCRKCDNVWLIPDEWDLDYV